MRIAPIVRLEQLNVVNRALRGRSSRLHPRRHGAGSDEPQKAIRDDAIGHNDGAM